MPITGLTDRSMERDARAGQIVRLGTIQKGERKGSGESMKMYDYDYLRFSPRNGDERLTAAYHEAYGQKPRMIPDVRIPVDLAGNFDIGDCSWLTASRHTKSGSTFLARSDGKTIYTMRDEKDGRRFIRDGVDHADYSKMDKDGKDCFVYDGKLYPWQRSFAIDLILPAFNQLVWRDGLFGLGVATLITTSTNDIVQLTSEYGGIIDDLVATVASPFADESEIERVRRSIPLRRIPLTLYRTEQTISTPNWGDKNDTAGRIATNKWLLHWSLSAEIAQAAQIAMDIETRRLIEGIATRPLLMNGPAQNIEQLNAELFADLDEDTPQIPATTQEQPEDDSYTGPNWEELGSDVWEDVEEDEEEEDYDWKEAIKEAETLDAFSFIYYQIQKPSGIFKDAEAVKKAALFFFGDEYAPYNVDTYIATLDVYVNVIADKGTVKAAKKQAAAIYEKKINEIPF